MASEKDKDPYRDHEYEEFNKVLGSISDPVLLILRMHLYAEYLLERIISCKLPRGDRHLNNGNIPFNQKLSLVSAFDYLPDELITSLKQLNSVRNQCAHVLHKEVTLSEVDKIGRPLGAKYTAIKKDNLDSHFKVLLDIFALIGSGLRTK